MKAYLINRVIRGEQLNRMIEIDWNNEERSWCDRYLATIQKRMRGLETAIKRHWQREGQVLEHGFSGMKERTPGKSPDSLRDANNLAELLANRCQGFNLSIELVNLGPFPCSGND